MNPALLLPAGLAALLALAIPIVIHIARRTESRTIDFAALRWLDPQPKPRRSLTIDERLLLAARLLLLALIALWLAAPVLWNAADVAPTFAAEPVDRAVPNSARHLIWLASGPVPVPVERWVRNGGVILTALEARIPVEGENVPVWRGTAGEPLAFAGRLGRGRVIRLTRALEPAAIPQLVEPDFPDALLSMLDPRPAPGRVAAVDHAPLAGAAPYDQPPLDLRPWLALLIAVAFAGERWLAMRRQRAVAP